MPEAVLKSIAWFIVAMMPLRINCLIISTGSTFTRSASSRTVMAEGIMMTLTLGAAAFFGAGAGAGEEAWGFSTAT
jgi:hypothetical protein